MFVTRSAPVSTRLVADLAVCLTTSTGFLYPFRAYFHGCVTHSRNDPLPVRDLRIPLPMVTAVSMGNHAVGTIAVPITPPNNTAVFHRFDGFLVTPSSACSREFLVLVIVLPVACRILFRKSHDALRSDADGAGVLDIEFK